VGYFFAAGVLLVWSGWLKLRGVVPLPESDLVATSSEEVSSLAPAQDQAV
jgi:hypothetical protein